MVARRNGGAAMSADEAVEDALDALWVYSGKKSFRADLVARFRKGRKRFGGNFDIDGNDWKEERREELLDAVIYTVFSMVKERGKGH